MSGVNTALVVLIVIWAVVLVSPALRARQTSPYATVGGFERTMELLSRGGSREQREAPQPSSVRPREHPLTIKRRTRFLRLLGATGLSLVVAVWLGGLVWTVFLLVAGATGAYAVVLRRLKVQRDEARRVVRELHLHPPDEQFHAAPGRAAAGAESMAGASTTVRLRRWDA